MRPVQDSNLRTFLLQRTPLNHSGNRPFYIFYYRNFCNYRTLRPTRLRAGYAKQIRGKKQLLLLLNTQVFLHGFEPRLSDPESDVLPLHHRKVYTVEIKGLEPLTGTVEG